jgi:hypothetical protein
MKKKLLLLFLLMSGITFGQISITYSDFSDAFSPGSTFNSYMTPIVYDSTISVYVGEASATAQYWDFSNYTFNHEGISVGVVPSTAPSINDFPTSNFVLFEKGWLLTGDTFHIYNYKELQTDQMLLLGLGDDTSAYITYDPPGVQAVVPLEYGATWTVSTGSVTVDAFGTMKLPSGEYECLRLRWDNVNLNYKPGMVNPTLSGMVNRTPSRHYIFYSKQIREVNVLNVPEDQFNLTTVDIMGFSFSDREGNAGISDKKNPSLAQNFPNPFNSQTTIRYNLASVEKVFLRIYDFLGKEVATPVNEVQSPGNHEVIFNRQGLSPGVYYYQLTYGDYSVTNKMMISR